MHKISPLSKLKLGQKAIIDSYAVKDNLIVTRLMTMGLTEGTQIEILNRFMGKDPILIKVRNGRIALRCKEASNVIVKEIQNEKE